MSRDSQSTEARDRQSLAGQIDAICDRFEAAWKATQRPRIEAYLDQAPLELRSSLLTELLAVELQHRRELGDEAQLDEYLDRFPDRREDVCAAFQRASSGDTVSSVKRKSAETFPTGQALPVRGTSSPRRRFTRSVRISSHASLCQQGPVG